MTMIVFTQLPYDIVATTASYLDYKSYQRLRFCCKRTSRLSSLAALQFHAFFSSIPFLKKIKSASGPLDCSLFMQLLSFTPKVFVLLCAVGAEREAMRILERFSLEDQTFNRVLEICVRFSQVEAEDDDVERFDAFCHLHHLPKATFNHFYRKDLTASLVKRMIATDCVKQANPNHIFHSACYSNDIVTARLLINVDGVDPAENECDTFGICCEEGYADIVELFLQDPRVDPSRDDNYAIQGAAENGLLEILNMLLEDPRTDPTSLENYAIGAACENGHIEVILRLLQDPRVNPADDDNYAFKNTIGSSIPEEKILQILQILLQDERVDPLSNDCEVVEKAVSHGQTLVLKFLADLPGMIITNAALTISAECGHSECVVFLLGLPQISPSDPEYPSPIIAACKKGHLDVVRLLLQDERCDPSVKDDYALRVACHFKHAEIVKVLLAHPLVDVTSRDNSAVKYMVKNRWQSIYNSIPRSKLKDFATHHDIFNKREFDFSSYADPEFATDDFGSSDNTGSDWESDYTTDSDDLSDDDDDDDFEGTDDESV